MRRLFQWLNDLYHSFKKGAHKCEVCGSWDTRYDTAWTRGWNDYCVQAIGDRGHFCNKCSHITWHQSYEDYAAGLPDWCRAYKDRPRSITINGTNHE